MCKRWLEALSLGFLCCGFSSLPSFWLLIFVFCSVDSPLCVWTFHFPIRQDIEACIQQKLRACVEEKNLKMYCSLIPMHLKSISLYPVPISLFLTSNGSQRNLILRYLAFSFDYLLHPAILNCVEWMTLKKSCLFCSFGSSVLLKNKDWECDMR